MYFASIFPGKCEYSDLWCNWNNVNKDTRWRRLSVGDILQKKAFITRYWRNHTVSSDEGKPNQTKSLESVS